MENTIYEQDKPKVVYAGFWWRFLAYIIDDLLIGAVSWISNYTLNYFTFQKQNKCCLHTTSRAIDSKGLLIKTR